MSSPPQQVVIAPELFGRSFVDRECRQVLELWRDRVIQPVVNRPLLVHYVRLLGALQFSEALVRRWAWWWNSKAKFIQSESPEALPVTALCSWVAAAVSPACVVHSGHPFDPPLPIPTDPSTWKTARVLLAELRPKTKP